MSHLVPVRIRIYRRMKQLDEKRAPGQSDMPPIKDLSPEVRRNLPDDAVLKLCVFVGIDKVENLGLGHDYDQWLYLMPEDLAEACHATWPHLCEVLTEAELETFHDTRCTVHIPDELVDEDVLDVHFKSAYLKERLGDPLTPAERTAIREALDPSHPAKGRRTNPRKTWAGRKGGAAWAGKIKAPGTFATHGLRPPPATLSDGSPWKFGHGE